MTGIVNWAKSWIPPAGTVDRTILYYWPFSALIQQTTDRNRMMATYATLGLQGRLSVQNNPFSQWMKDIKDPAFIKAAENEPVKMLSALHLNDLVCKVIVSVGFFATSHISFYTTLTHLLSHSQKVSKVAQPFLDRAASLPIPRLLQSARVIAFAPVVVKLLHIAFIAIDPKGENSVLELFKKGADKVGQALEFLWCLRFSLVSLGISKNFHQSIASTLFNQTLNYFVKNPQVRPLITLPIMLFMPKPGEEAQGYKHLLSLIGGMDSFWPTKGFELGLIGMWSALSASTAPHDIATLEQLYTEITTTEMSPAKIDTVRQLRLRIKQAVRNEAIDPGFAHELEELIVARGVDVCFAIQNVDDLKKNEAIVKELCVPNLNAQDANIFFQILLSLRESEIKTHKQALDALSVLLDPVHAKMLEGKALQSLKKFVLNRIESLEISSSSAYDFLTLLTFCKITCRECPADFERLQSVVWDKIFQIVSSVDLSQLNTDDEFLLDKNMYHLAGAAKTPEQFERAYFMLQQYHIARLNLNLKWYLDMQPRDVAKQQACEDLLYRLASRFDTDPVSQLASYQKQDTAADVQQFVWESKAFDFARNTLPIPADFKFATFNLPYTLGWLSRDVNATQDRWTFAQNFPAPTCNELTARGFPSKSVYVPRHIGFVSTEEIRKAAQD